MGSRLIDLLARYLAQPVKPKGASTAADAQRLSALLLQGDVLLADGVTRMAALVRRITRSPWSHVAMYVGPLDAGPDPCCVVEADVAAGVRAVPLSEFDGQRVRVLRPAGLRDGDRRRLADWVVGRIGDGYDHAHAWHLTKRLLGLPFVSPLAPAPGTLEGTRRFVCSTLLAQAFLLVGYPVVPDPRYVTPRDFEGARGFDIADTHLCQPAPRVPSAAHGRHADLPHSST